MAYPLYRVGQHHIAVTADGKITHATYSEFSSQISICMRQYRFMNVAIWLKLEVRLDVHVLVRQQEEFSCLENVHDYKLGTGRHRTKSSVPEGFIQ